MKRLILILALAVMLCTALNPAYADDIRQSGETDAFIITSDSYTPYEFVPVVVLTEGTDAEDISSIVSAGGDISEKIVFTGTMVSDADGNANYTVPMGTNVPDGIYVFYIGGIKHEIGFMRNSNRINLVDKVVYSGSKLSEVLAENYMYLSLDNDLYDLCSGSEEIAKILAKELKETNLSSNTPNATEILGEIINKSALTVAANEEKLTNISQIEKHMSDCENTKEVTELLSRITESGKDKLLKDFQGNSFSGVEDADVRFGEETVLKAICYPAEKTSKALLNILDEYNFVLGLNLSAFNKLSNASRSEAIVKFSNEKPTIKNMQSVLDEIVDSYETDKPLSGGNGGGGGSRGNSASPYIPLVDSGITNISINQTPTSAFNDIAGVEWAKEAILTLNEKGIISGYGNGTFAPDANIKREEFLKLVVSAFYPDEESAQISFDDVSADAWYYDYVGIGVNKGIIKGISENLFGSGMNITRQDMAVILYNVGQSKITANDNVNMFADDEEISDYAKESVYALRDAGVINGVSETEFAPQNNATRAETAVMLYRFMKLLNGGE